jgi:uncharacterized protein
MYIDRHCEKSIKRMQKNFSALLITGSRQVGKTTMLKEIHPTMNYVSLDDFKILQSAKDDPSLFFQVYKPPVIVDEVQYAPDLFRYVKMESDKNKEKGIFYMTGSQAFHLMKNVTESMAGRVGIIQLMGLSLREINKVHHYESFLPTTKHIEFMSEIAPKPDYWTIMNKIHKGSFPVMHESEKDDKEWRDFYTSYFRTYIERDVRQLTQIGDEASFMKFMQITAATTGQLLNYSSISKAIGKDITTVQRWMSILEASGIVYILPPYHKNVTKRVVKTPKLHFLDSGLACYLTGWNTAEQMALGAMAGKIFESFVFSEILKSYYNDGDVKPPLYFHRDSDGNEIDIIIQNGEFLYPVEVKLSGTPNKGDIKTFKYLEKIEGIKKGEGCIVCMSGEPLFINQMDRILPVTYL